MLLQELFTHHPHSVGESYLEHQRQALAFGSAMLGAGIACLLHALVPALFTTTGSRTVSRLYDRMVLKRARLERRVPAGSASPVWPDLRIVEEAVEPPPGGFRPLDAARGAARRRAPQAPHQGYSRPS
jgi:hypothetical protein